MSTSTELDVVTNGGQSLFAGATPNDVITAATEVANAFSSVVQDQRLFVRIGNRDHVLIEGWQTVGTLVGVFAVKDGGVAEMPWPELAKLGERPQDPGREPPRSAPTWQAWKDATELLDHWELHRALLNAKSEGLAFGFAASYHAVKDGRVIGWGEGRCTRHERNWIGKEDHALASQAETRGQSRTLAAPLRFIVKLAGYATTPAEDMDPAAAEQTQAQAARIAELERELVAAQAGAVTQVDMRTLGLDEQENVVKALETSWPMYDGVKFVAALERRFPEGIPEFVGTALRAWAWFCEQPANRVDLEPQNAAQQPTEDEGETS
jgi:hypothetical protein